MSSELWTAERIVLTGAHIRILKEAARAAHPFEAVALLLGMRGEGVIEVTDVVVAGNVDRSRVTFQVDPQILLEVYRRADEEGKEVVSIFHSHPSPPSPSALDVQFMQANPVVWLILSTTSDQLKAYQLQGEAIKPVDIVQKP